jgi:hypothetical protein
MVRAAPGSDYKHSEGFPAGRPFGFGKNEVFGKFSENYFVQMVARLQFL